MGRGSRTREGTEGTEREAHPLLESEVGARLVEEELGTPAQRPEPVDGSG